MAVRSSGRPNSGAQRKPDAVRAGRIKCPACNGTGWLTSAEFKDYEQQKRRLHEKLLAVNEHLQSEKEKNAELKRSRNREVREATSELRASNRGLTSELQELQSNREAEIDAAVRSAKRTWDGGRDAAIAAGVEKKLKELAVTPADLGRGHEKSLVALLRERFPHHRVTARGKNGDNDLEVLDRRGNSLGGINTEVKACPVITSEYVRQTQNGFGRSKMQDYRLIVTTAKYVSVDRKRRQFHFFEYLPKYKMMIVNRVIAASVYDFLVALIEAREAAQLSPKQAFAAGSRMERWLRSPSWRKYLERQGERLNEKLRRLELDIKHANTSQEERRDHIFLDRFDWQYIAHAVADLYAGREPALYIQPRAPKSKNGALSTTSANGGKPSRAARLRPVA